METIFNKIKKKDYLDILNVIKTPINKNEMYNDYCKGHQGKINLYNEWEKSIALNNPNYNLYNSVYYLDEAFVCWKTCSRKNIMILDQYIKSNNEYSKELYEIKNILDLGCGIGFSTVALSEVFKNANIIGTQLKESVQFEVCEYLEENNKNVKFVSSEYNTKINKKFDLIFASEFFEHFDHPINLLEDLINSYSPKYIICANTFTQMSLGHFYEYYDENNNKYDGKKMSRYFNNKLREHSYEKIKTGFWNDRPRVWRKKD